MAQFPSNINLSSLDGTTGFRISGEAADNWSGFSVAAAGDVNGDRFAMFNKQQDIPPAG